LVSVLFCLLAPDLKNEMKVSGGHFLSGKGPADTIHCANGTMATNLASSSRKENPSGWMGFFVLRQIRKMKCRDPADSSPDILFGFR